MWPAIWAIVAVAVYLIQTGSVTAEPRLQRAGERSGAPALPHSGDLSGVLVDMSSHNSTIVINVDTLKDSQSELVIHRLTIGRYDKSVDKFYQSRFEEVRRAGAKFGALHILFPSRDGRENGVEQAQGFLHAIRDFCPADQKIVLSVDWEETQCYTRGKFKPCGIPEPSYILSFLKYVKSRVGIYPIVYTDRQTLKQFSDEIARNANLKAVLIESPLWFSQPQREFRTKTNLVSQWGYFFPLKEDIAPWQDWTFWQFNAPDDNKNPNIRPTDAMTLTVGGKAADLSWYNGGRNEFRHFYDKNSISCKSIMQN
jgi:hypothetical protein